MRGLAAVSALLATICGVNAHVQTLSLIPDDDSLDTVLQNAAILNETLQNAEPGTTIVIANETYWLMGGIKAFNLDSVTLQIDGTLSFSDLIEHWPIDANGKVFECMYFENAKNVTFTSSSKGTMDGNGKRWWGLPGIGYLVREENRPRLFHIASSTQVLVENLFFKDSPYWTFWAPNVDGLEVRWTDIDVRRTEYDGHDLLDMTAFNTDGFDVTGKNVWIHDCNVWNQDDCIAVKDGSENMLFERINASGVGLTIGSISGSVVRNITFRDCYMHHTYKGIYTKFRDGDNPGSISDVLFENIVIEEPEQWAIWLGPAQQSDSRRLCAAHPCSICWPEVPSSECNAPVAGSYANITLRNVTVNNPKSSPGVLLGNESNPMQNVVFEDVIVNSPGDSPWGEDYYYCENVQGVAIGATWPVPPCFEDLTTQ